MRCSSREADALVDELLARSRLELSVVDPRRVAAVALARRALERAGVSAEHLDAPEDEGAPEEPERGVAVEGDRRSWDGRWPTWWTTPSATGAGWCG